MRAWGKLCLLLVLMLAAAGALEAEKGRGICPDDKKTCQIGENEWTCVGLDEKCPKPSSDLKGKKEGRGICPDDKKTCQIGENEWKCIDLDEECG